MRKRIAKIFCFSAALTFSLVYFVITALFSIPAAIYYLTYGKDIQGAKDLALMFFGLPFVYGIGSFLIVLIVCFFYNAISKATGGISVDLED